MEKRELQLMILTDKTRLQTVKLLLRHDLCVRELARRLEISGPAVSQHLSLLFKSGLLSKQKRGYHMHYAVNRSELLGLSAYFEELAGTEKETCEEKECQGGHCNCKES